MSQPQPDQLLAAEVSDLLVSNYIAYSCVVWIFYEYIITFEREVTVVWKRKLTLTSVLLITTRWVMILNAAVTVAPSTPKVLPLFSSILSTIGRVQTSLFICLRVYAIWEQRILWPLIVTVLGIVPVVTSAYTAARAEFEYIGAPLFTCAGPPGFSDRVYHIFVYSTDGANTLASVIVLVLTWIKTFRQWNEARKMNLMLSISACLLRDGTLFFIALTAINVAHILTFDSITSPVGAFIDIMPAILITRFMFNLRSLSNVNASQTDSDPQHFSRFTVPNFRVPSNFIGDIGQPLVHGQSMDPGLSAHPDIDEGYTTTEGSLSDMTREEHGSYPPDISHDDADIIVESRISKVESV